MQVNGLHAKFPFFSQPSEPWTLQAVVWSVVWTQYYHRDMQGGRNNDLLSWLSIVHSRFLIGISFHCLINQTSGSRNE